ncbi:cytochrome P450 [Actinomadura scrupuli]
MSVAERHETRLMKAGNPGMFSLLRAARFTGRIRRLPRLGWVVTDPLLAREVLNNERCFDILGKGGAGHMWMQLLGDELEPLFSGVGHVEFRTRTRDLFTEKGALEIVERSQGDYFRSIGERLAAGETVDLAESSRLLSGRIICDLLGIDLTAEVAGDPDEPYRTVFDAVVRLARFALGTASPDEIPAELLERAREIISFITRNVQNSYPAAPPDTILGRCRELGFSLTMARGLGTLLAVAGTETAASAMVRTVAMLHDTGQQAALLADPTLIEGAVREGLRITTPVPAIGRHVRRDTTVGGRRLRAGQRVTLLTYVANNRAGTFDITQDHRRENRQLWFGGGRHLCLGAAIARAEVRRMLATVTAEGRPWRVVSREAARQVIIPAYHTLRVRLG